MTEQEYRLAVVREIKWQFLGVPYYVDGVQLWSRKEDPSNAPYRAPKPFVDGDKCVGRLVNFSYTICDNLVPKRFEILFGTPMPDLLKIKEVATNIRIRWDTVGPLNINVAIKECPKETGQLVSRYLKAYLEKWYDHVSGNANVDWVKEGF